MDDLEKAHKIFRDEVTTAAWAFFVWKSFNNIVSSDKDLFHTINQNALSWNTLTNSLQTTFFITLGRLFDTDGDAFSVHAFLNSCKRNITQFSHEECRKRKIKLNGGVVPDWLDDYIKNAYEAKASDFDKLKREVSEQQNIYIEVYRPIRHKVLAHKETATIENVGELFGKTNIGQIQHFIYFLHQIENVVFDLLYNGTLNKIGDYEFREDVRAHEDVAALLKRLKT